MAETPQFSHRTKPVTFTNKDTGQPVARSTSMKLFRPGTFQLLEAFQERIRHLPQHVLLALQAKWKPNERSISISAFNEPGQETFYMPQTADDEDELVTQLKAQMADVEDEIVKLQYAHNVAHVVAFEQQLLALRANGAVQRAWPNKPGALQDSTIEALKTATTYCWAPNCVEATAAAADRLTPDSMPAELPLGEIMAPAAAGWWWFEKPIPVPTTTSNEPICALLWRRELREFTQWGKTFVRSGTWFNAFILESVNFNGRMQLVPSPTLAWIWYDDMPISGLRPQMTAAFNQLEQQGRIGIDSLSSADSAVTAEWLSKFWMAGGTYLDSRITAKGKRRPALMGKVTTALPRQQARRLARLHHLGALPTVEVVYLRRYEPRESAGGPSRTRDHEYCWLVKEFPRRQWFPSLGRHQLVMVREHIRGPKDRPLKHAKRIYAVNR